MQKLVMILHSELCMGHSLFPDITRLCLSACVFFHAREHTDMSKYYFKLITNITIITTIVAQWIEIISS